eukprot:1152281-Pelagomonas_calceolata.AAC.5
MRKKRASRKERAYISHNAMADSHTWRVDTGEACQRFSAKEAKSHKCQPIMPALTPEQLLRAAPQQQRRA